MTCEKCNRQMSKDLKGYGRGMIGVCVECASAMEWTAADCAAYQSHRGGEVNTFAALIAREATAGQRFNSPNCG